MLIKRVVVQGFKTFAQKTEFIFDPGVTAIVGPNGSGKSNIVDAIRWCLGEQSFSLLRSKKTSDIIFSGSDKKARMGMAEVSLTLDNSGGEIPVDFEEVVITRRAYRDGDNEYLINGQRVRLLDVTQLLAQTGLGKRTYAVVGQGLIDRVLSLAPEERRALFEEAAGITGYQIKRQTTLRRLDATQQNLTRVQDIVTELSPRLRYLKRQADRANERSQIADDLRGLLRIWYGYRWHTALARLEHNHTEEEKFKASVEMRQRALTELGEKVASLRGEQTLLRARLGDLHARGSVVHREAEEVGRELAVAQERLRQLQARLEETQRELAPLRLQKESVDARIADLAATLESAESQTEERRVDVVALERTLAARQEERQGLQRAVDDARRRVNTLLREQGEASSRLQQLQEQRARLERERDEQATALDATTKNLETLRLQVADAQRELEQTRHEGSELTSAIEQLTAIMESRRNELRSAEEARQAADRVTDRLQTRIDLLQRLRDEGAGYASGVRAVLQAAGENQALDGIVGTVASLVRVPAHLDKAMETALGGALQNVVTARWSVATAAIDFLKRTGNGRVTFLPLDRLSVLPAIDAPNAPGILGNAAELVDFDPQVDAVVQQLLGRVWVAEDLPAARRALDAIRSGPRPTVVTVEGEIVRPGGAVTGGSDRNRRDDSILARERELRELPGQLEQAQRESQAAGRRCGQMATQIEETQLQVTELQQRLADLSRDERRRQQVLEERRLQLDRAEQSVQYQRNRARTIDAELGETAVSQQQLDGRLLDLQQDQQDAEQTLAAREADVARAGDGDLLRQLADVRAAEAEAQGHLRSQRTLHENQRRLLQSVADQIRAKEERIQSLTAEAEQLGARVAALSAREAELGKRIAGLTVEIEPAEAQLHELEQAQTNAEQQERHLQHLLRQDETAWNNAQLQRQRTEDAIQQLHNEIEQDLGLVMVEESEEMAYQPPLPLETFVEQLPVILELPEGMDAEVKEMRMRLGRVSNVNPEAPREYAEAAERYEHLVTQSEDLEAAAADLRKVVRELDELMEVELTKTFQAVAEQFEHFFKLLFNGGTAKLVLTEPDDITNTGVEIIARPPGKRPQSLALLSGGERTLSACALIFAILRVSPTPFCVLDEVDAALDEANVDRFRLTLEDLSDGTQFIIVTHNRRTLEGANTIYGVTMGNDGVSKTLSLRLEGNKMVQADGDTGEGNLEAIEEVVQM